jgi:periplasmic divalent cation tolerance protein
MEDYLQVLISTDSHKGAHALQQVLLQERAAACVQILGPVASAYWWEGRIEEAQEWLCLAKTRRSEYKRLEALVKDNHPYETPEIIAISVLLGNRRYLDWIDAETGA